MSDDRRRQGQERYVLGRQWASRSFRPYHEGWDHDHCEFCGEKFSQVEGDLHQGFVTLDNYHWVCERCFADFREEMKWTVE